MIRRWDKSKPPTGPFALNRDCPQALGLVAWWPMGGAGVGYAPDMAGTHHAIPGTRAASATLGDDGRPALSLVAASNQYLGAATAPITNAPVTLTAWGKTDGSTQTPIFLCGATLNPFFRIVLVSNKVRANAGTDFNGTQANAITTASYTSGAWQLFGATFASRSDRTAYLNGGNAVNDTTALNANVTSILRTRLGVAITTAEALLQPFNGDLGECGIWDVSLDASMHARLYSPATRFELWYPLRSRKWISIAAASVPTLSASTYVSGSLTSTGWRPQVTAS